MKFVYLIAAIACEVVATSALKASDGFSRPGPAAVTVVGYGISFYLLALALREIPVGIAYAVWSGTGIVLISAIGWIVFGQKLDSWGVFGLGLIIAGVLVVNFLSRTSVH